MVTRFSAHSQAVAMAESLRPMSTGELMDRTLALCVEPPSLSSASEVSV
jgi:hypothetical protein